MTPVEELLIGYRELTLVCFTCPNCKADHTFDILNEKQSHFFNSQYPLTCTLCEAKIDKEVYLALRDFYRWHEKLRTSSFEIFFRLSDTSSRRMKPS